MHTRCAQELLCAAAAASRISRSHAQVCEEQPGEVPGVNVTGGGSRCIPVCLRAFSRVVPCLTTGAQIDPGSLTFCTGVSYVSCLRVPVPDTYDKLVSDVRIFSSANSCCAHCRAAHAGVRAAHGTPSSGVPVRLGVALHVCVPVVFLRTLVSPVRRNRRPVRRAARVLVVLHAKPAGMHHVVCRNQGLRNGCQGTCTPASVAPASVADADALCCRLDEWRQTVQTLGA